MSTHTRRPTATRTAVLLIALAMLAGLPAAAAAAAQSDLGEAIDMDLEDASMLDLMQSMATVLGTELAIDPQVAERKVTVQLDDVPLSQALDEVCKVSGCRWQLLAGEPALLTVRSVDTPPAEPISMSLRDADVREVLAAFGSIAVARSVHVAPELSGTLTIELKAVPWDAALDRVCMIAGCGWRFDRETGELRIEASGGAGTGSGVEGGAVRLEGGAVRGRPAPGLAARLSTVPAAAPAAAPVTGLAAFDWSRRTAHLSAPPRRLTLSWLALGPAPRAGAPWLDVVVPLLIDCRPQGGSAVVRLLEPAILPLAGGEGSAGAAYSWQGDGVTVELLAPGMLPGAPPLPAVAAATAGSPCAETAPARLTVELAVPSAGEVRSRHFFTVRAPGDSYQIAPPPTRRRPTSQAGAALVYVGSRGAALDLALVRPDGAGGVTVEEVALAPGESFSAPLTAGAGAGAGVGEDGYELTVSAPAAVR